MTKTVGMWFYWQYKFIGILCGFARYFSFASHAKETKNHHG
jgi:hypothetical protein